MLYRKCLTKVKKWIVVHEIFDQSQDLVCCLWNLWLKSRNCLWNLWPKSRYGILSRKSLTKVKINCLWNFDQSQEIVCCLENLWPKSRVGLYLGYLWQKSRNGLYLGYLWPKSRNCFNKKWLLKVTVFSAQSKDQYIYLFLCCCWSADVVYSDELENVGCTVKRSTFFVVWWHNYDIISVDMFTFGILFIISVVQSLIIICEEFVGDIILYSNLWNRILFSFFF